MTQRSRYSFDLFLHASSSQNENLAQKYGGAPVGAFGFPGSLNYWEVNWSNIVPFNDLGENARFNCLITPVGYVLPRGFSALNFQLTMGSSYALGLTTSGMDICSKPMQMLYEQFLVSPIALIGGSRPTYDAGWTLDTDPTGTLQYYASPFNLIIRNPSRLGLSKIYFTPLVAEIDTGTASMDGEGGGTISYQLQFDLISTD